MQELIDPARIKQPVRPEVSKGERLGNSVGFDTSARTDIERLFVPDQ